MTQESQNHTLAHYAGPDATSKYDAASFYMKSTDERGHGTSLYIKIEPRLLSLVKTMVNDERFPYRSNPDFIRDALVKRGHDLLEATDAGNPTQEQKDEFGSYLLEAQRIKIKAKKDQEIETIEWFDHELSDNNLTQVERQSLVTNARFVIDQMSEERRPMLERIVSRWS